MSKLSKSVLDKIKKEDIAPRPKWQFVLVHVLLWSAVVAAVILGSMATGVLLKELVYTEWEFLHRVGRGAPAKGFVMVLPYFWIGSLVLITVLSSWLFTKTKRAYKIRPLFVVIGTVVISILLGAGVFMSKAADRFEDVMRENVGPYAQFKEFREKMWVDPDHGLLSGRIVEVTSEEVLVIDDLTGKRWQVEIAELDFEPEVGMRVVAIGEVKGDGVFEAEMVRVRTKDGSRPPLRKPGERLPRPPKPLDGEKKLPLSGELPAGDMLERPEVKEL